jgi:C-terminal processing protease CtpA/Prc
LIVDVRRNGGGNTSYGFPILRALAQRHFALSSSWVLASSGFWRTRGFGGVEMRLPVDSVPPDTAAHYPGAVALLVGPLTYSAAEDFAAAWRGIGRGPIIGEPTGGSTGQPVFFPLPGGGMARVRTKHDVGPGGLEFDGLGIQPDVVVRRTVAELQAGRDEVLEAAVRVIRGAVQ